MATQPTVASVFSEAQRNAALHRRCTHQLLKMLKKHPLEFRVQFNECVHRFLPVFKKEPAVQRLVQFTIAFVLQVWKSSDLGDLASAFAPSFIEVRRSTSASPRAAFTA